MGVGVVVPLVLSRHGPYTRAVLGHFLRSRIFGRRQGTTIITIRGFRLIIQIRRFNKGLRLGTINNISTTTLRTTSTHENRNRKLFEHFRRVALFRVVVGKRNNGKVFLFRLLARLLSKCLVIIIYNLVNSRRHSLDLCIKLVYMIFLRNLRNNFLGNLRLFLFQLNNNMLRRCHKGMGVLITISIRLFFRRLRKMINRVSGNAFLRLTTLTKRTNPLLCSKIRQNALRVLNMINMTIFMIRLRSTRPQLAVTNGVRRNGIYPQGNNIHIRMIRRGTHSTTKRIRGVIIILRLIFGNKVQRQTTLTSVITNGRLFSIMLRVNNLFNNRFRTTTTRCEHVRNNIRRIRGNLVGSSLRKDCLIFVEVSLTCDVTRPNPGNRDASYGPPTKVLRWKRGAARREKRGP